MFNVSTHLSQSFIGFINYKFYANVKFFWVSQNIIYNLCFQNGPFTSLLITSTSTGSGSKL